MVGPKWNIDSEKGRTFYVNIERNFFGDPQKSLHIVLG